MEKDLIKAIENTTASKIKSITTGVVKISGEAISKGELLKSPFSKKDCVYYRVLIEEYKIQNTDTKFQGNVSMSGWQILSLDKSQKMFYIKDETGTILVDPKLADMDLKIKTIKHSSIFNRPSKEIIDFLESKNIHYKGIFGTSRLMRFTETYIEPKEKIYVIGTARINMEKASNEYKKSLVTRGDNELLYITDKSEEYILRKLKLKMLNKKVLIGIFILLGIIILALAIRILFMK